ncbi:MAG TPA: DUF5723 family protein [Chitinophagales bacterium]|nr:DUF5723 family protein [Chitinophagales bacterium]
MKKINFILFILSGLLYNQSKAQQDFTLYNMNYVHQRSYLNPAFIPGGSRIFVGIPLLSSQYISVNNNGFKYSDAVKHRLDDSLYIDYANVLSKLSKNNYLSVAYHPDIISFGMAVEKNYFSLNVTEKVDFRFRYPKSFMEFLWKGNGAYLDKEMNFNFGLNFMHYREYAIGAARQINDKLSLGLKLKYLYGMENFSTKKTDITLMTAADDFAITAKGNIELNSAGFNNDDDSADFNFSEYAFGRKNHGFGADLGFEYKASEKFTLSASLLDIGSIKWNYKTNNYISHDQNAHFTYRGFELNQLINSDSSSTEDIGKALGDSLAAIFKIDTLHQSYKTRLTPQMYIGGNFIFSEVSSGGILLYWQAFDKTVHPGLALSYNHKILDWLNLSASYSIYNRAYTNVGLGAAICGEPVQFYIVTDNVLGLIFPQSTKSIQFHFGLNFIFGRKAKGSTGASPEPATPPTTPGTN